ncbi:MAG TPA: hypothetical protein VFK90_10105 [Anaeromyxobacter sp.]|nr:hypothetical protein [Anaeromyxobacter sp.]
MSDITLKRIEEIEPYTGPRTIPGIAFRPAARALGVTAWGMNVLDLQPNVTGYPEHDHAKDGQEWRLEPGVLVRVGPGQRRKFVPGAEGATILAIGSTPGKAYEPRR